MTARRKHQQSQLRRAFGCAITLLTISLLSWGLAGGNTPALTLYPLYQHQPNGLAPAGEPLEVDPDPRAAVLAERLRQHLAGLQTAPSTPPLQLTPEQSQALSALETRCPGEVSVVFRLQAGTPRQIKGAVLQSAQAGSDSELTTARTFLHTYCDLLRLEDPNAELVLVHRHTDELGRTHLRFRQQYQGVPVWPTDIIVHLNPEGHVDIVNGAFVPTPEDLSTIPVIDKTTAVEYARTGLTDGAEAEVTTSELIIYAPGDTLPRLAWKLELAINVTAHWVVVIDAVNGAELTAYSQIMHQNVEGMGVDLFDDIRPLNVWEEDGVFRMIDTSKKEMFNPDFNPLLDIDSERGVIRIRDAENRPETSDPEEIHLPFPIRVARSAQQNSGWVPDAVSAAYNLSEVYDYYWERHGRNSFDDDGASITAIVRLGQDFDNAFWHTGLNLLAFGDSKPYAGALDVVGHELTHGVITHSANLIYRDQPGALNEAFADIFGEMIEAWSIARTTDRLEPDWLIGTKLITELNPPIRNMANPATLTFDQGGTRPYPTKMSEYIYTQADNGGVHVNSSIINRAFYLLAEGFDGAIGLEAAEQIFYRALTVYLFQYSQFIDARLACIQAAKDLSEMYPDAVPPDAVQKVEEAFDAVEIFGAAPTPPPRRVPAFPGPDASLFVYRDVGGDPRLGRREEAQGDKVQGVQLADAVLATAHPPVPRSDDFVVARPSVSRDGELAVFVNTDNDVCSIRTDGEREECFGLPDQDQPIHIYSVAISPDGRWLGLVLLDELDRNPQNRILVISLETDEVPRFYELRAPSPDGPPLDTIRYARTMDFTLDGQWIIYDALNAASFDYNTRIERWSLYALNLNTGRNLELISPEPGFQIAFPALSQTSDNFLTFDVFDEYRNQSAVYIANLHTGELSPIATVEDGFGVPGFTGDDAALVYSQRDPRFLTGFFSLVRQPLQDDLMTPQGQPSIWLENAHFGVIYRRAGRYAGLTGVLENPLSDSSQSGVGLFSGWACLTGPRGEPPSPSVPAVVERYFYDALEHKESSVDDGGNWWARTDSTNGTHITGQTTVQEVVDQVQRFTISYVDDDGHDRTEFYETILGASRIFIIDIGNVRLSWPITGLSKSTLPPPPRSPAGTVIPPRITVDVVPGAFVRNQDGSPWVPAPLTQTIDELGRDMYVVNILQPYIPGRLEVSRVEIDINGTIRLPAAYRTERRDTTGVCGDSDNGFGLLFNWNLLGDGTHTVRALADGVEFDRATFKVTTLGTEFVRGAEGMCTVNDFPTQYETVTLHWQESMQNFVIADDQPPSEPVQTASAAVPRVDGLSGLLENPFSGSFQSGIGLFSGWVCDASQVEIEIDGDPTLTFMAGYGTNRIDTTGVCGDSNNGFGLLFNWNLLGDGTHTVRALADGVEFDHATFTVTTLGKEFVRDVEGECTVSDFPTLGETVTLRWQESMQNFVITDYQPQ